MNPKKVTDEELCLWLMTVTTYVCHLHHALKTAGPPPMNPAQATTWEDEGFARWMGWRGQEEQEREIRETRAKKP